MPSPEARHQHILVWKHGSYTGRLLQICTLCSWVDKWYNIPSK